MSDIGTDPLEEDTNPVSMGSKSESRSQPLDALPSLPKKEVSNYQESIDPIRTSQPLSSDNEYALVRQEVIFDAAGGGPIEKSLEGLNEQEWYEQNGIAQSGYLDTNTVPPVNTIQNPEPLTTSIMDEPAEEDDENAALLNSAHPLMERVQEAIREQLTRRIGQLELELREKEEETRKGTHKREEVGMELYTLQQQLARTQATLEGAEDNFGIIRGMREEAERKLKHTAAEYRLEQEKLGQHKKNLEQHKAELEKLSRSLRQVDLYNEELRSKILVAKRTTLKAEEDIIKLEMEKKRQDFFINELTEQLRSLQERRALYEHQLITQQKETKAAVETLQEAETEMEAIQFEKRQLLNQWKSSLIGLQRRDDVLLQIQKGLEKNKETLAGMTSEIAGYRRAHRKSQEEGETLSMILSKLENEIDYLKRQIGSLTEQREKLKETYSMYLKSLNQAEQELAQLQQERNSVQLEINAIQKASLQNAQATQKLESEVAERLQQQLTLKKGSQGAQRDGSRLRAKIHEKESKLVSLDNEVGGVRLEALNTASRIDRMRERVKTIDVETEERNQLIEKYEQEIRRRNDDLAKKASEMDFLNKKYNQVTGGNEEEHMGPLEATIHNLTKTCQAKENECTELQQFWLRAQNELVAMNKQALAITDETQNLKMRLTVLNRKKMVVNNAFESEEREIRDHQRSIRQLQNDMIKINTLLSKQSNVYGQLEEVNLELEQEFRAKLKQAELESIQMETCLENIKTEKDEALRGLVEAERQIMLWEKKIQLARETQSALDPNIGATEIHEMGLEIHRMKLRYASMLKLQEKMIAEMEKSVYRRESIATRGRTKGKGVGQIALQKAIMELSKKIKQTIQDVSECDQDISALEKSQEEVQRQTQESQQSCKALEEQEGQLIQLFEQVAVKRAIATNETLVYQRHLKRYADLKDNKYTFLASDSALREQEVAKSHIRLQKIHSLIQALVNTSSAEIKPLVSQFSDFIVKNAPAITQ